MIYIPNGKTLATRGQKLQRNCTWNIFMTEIINKSNAVTLPMINIKARDFTAMFMQRKR
jgi:hypothetical protein